MAPLHIEAFHPISENWVMVGKFFSTDPKGSMSDNKPDGSRDIYLFECAGDDLNLLFIAQDSGLTQRWVTLG